MFFFLFLSVLFLSYSNGANDNFKGVATLFGSKTTNYKSALFWATAMTFLGSISALFLSSNLTLSFSGRGLVSDTMVSSDIFLISVGAGAAVTVWLATILGFPISTTHALVGALVGAGIASGSDMHFEKLWKSFFMPLLASPLISVGLTLLLYPFFKLARQKLNVQEETCVCIGEKVELVQVNSGGAVVLQSSGLALTADQMQVCQQKYFGTIVGVNAQESLNTLHYVTAGAVSFARGLNDTPKITALLAAGNLMGINNYMLLVGLGMALGGLLNARKVALTMGKKITAMNHGQGFTANLVTAFIVIFASRWGLPASTTHVSCSALFGIGIVNKKADWNVIRNIFYSWLITLPLAALFSFLIFYLFGL